MSDVFVFYAKALQSIYGIAGHLPETNEVRSISALKQLELKICKLKRVSSKGVAKTLQSFEREARWKQLHWRCDVIFDSSDPLNPRYRLEFLPPALDAASCIVHEHLGCHRFLKVAVSGVASPFEYDGNVASQFWRQHWAASQLFRRGIPFGGKCYRFLGGELLKATRRTTGGSAKDRCMTLWFFCEEFSPSPSLSDPAPPLSRLPIPLHRPMTIQALRTHLGHLEALSTGKCNARIKLGFSSVLPVYLAASTVIRVVPDVLSDSTAAVMTDGCGLIAADLAHALPYAVYHGVAHSARSPTMPWPLLIQVRCLCREGLFKGCLLVTGDAQLCPPNTILFRASMKKDGGVPPGDAFGAFDAFWASNPPVLGVVDTFEHASWLASSSATAAKGALGEIATVVKPSGSFVTRSPWLIQTGYLSPTCQTPRNSALSAMISTSARPNSA